jgi:LmbE family N-acetylglucosaminyl deacetylase
LVVTTAPDIVVLSPHLDDAVLSIGALLAREVQAGRRVEVWTFFSQGPPLDELPPERRVFGDYTARLAEDERALAVLGVGERRLGFVERIWLAPPLPGTLHVFRTPPSIAHFRNLSAMGAAIAAALSDSRTEVLVPLGVGNHHDHVEVTVAALQVLLAGAAWHRVRFYEDVYALGTLCRRRHAITRRRWWPRGRGPGWASPRIAGLLSLVGASARGPGIETLVPEVAGLAWSCEVAPADGYEDAKLAAIAAYASQVVVFGGMHRVDPFIRRAHRLLGGEPLWRATPATAPRRAQPAPEVASTAR